MTGEVLCSYESEYLLPSPHLGMAQHARVWQPSVPAAMNEHRHCSLDSVSVAAMVLATVLIADAVRRLQCHPRGQRRSHRAFCITRVLLAVCSQR